jgi:hypothetical protein
MRRHGAHGRRRIHYAPVNDANPARRPHAACRYCTLPSRLQRRFESAVYARGSRGRICRVGAPERTNGWTRSLHASGSCSTRSRLGIEAQTPHAPSVTAARHHQWTKNLSELCAMLKAPRTFEPDSAYLAGPMWGIWQGTRTDIRQRPAAATFSRECFWGIDSKPKSAFA